MGWRVLRRRLPRGDGVRDESDRGEPPGVRRQLAAGSRGSVGVGGRVTADLELERTRGIRLFN